MWWWYTTSAECRDTKIGLYMEIGEVNWIWIWIPDGDEDDTLYVARDNNHIQRVEVEERGG